MQQTEHSCTSPSGSHHQQLNSQPTILRTNINETRNQKDEWNEN